MGTEEINTDTTDSRNSKDAFFDPKPKPKMIRVLTVLAYVLSVSMAAIFLSIYYIFMWNGEPHLGAQKSGLFNYSRIGESETGLNDSLHVHHLPKALGRIAVLGNVNVTENVTLSDFNIKEDLLNDSNNTTTNSTNKDLQQQFPAVETEMRLPSPTTISEDNTTNWQEDYNDSLEDLKTSKLIKKLWERDEENY